MNGTQYAFLDMALFFVPILLFLLWDRRKL